MNKQRYLAELRRLLVFMNEEDRDEAVRRCAEAFDAAGPEGEAVLLADMGSPTKMAIQLSRGYEPGRIPDVIPKTAVVRPKAAEVAEAPAADGELLPPEPAITWTELPTFDAAEARPADEAPGASASREAGAAPAGEPVPEAEPAAAEAPAPAPDPTPEPAPAETPAPASAPPVNAAPEAPAVEEGADEAPGPRTVIERTMPLGLGIPLFILVFGALGIPLGVLCLALSLVLLAPGCAILFGAYLVGVGGLWCTSYMADAALMFGAAFIVLAVGLLVLWLGIWLAVQLWTVYGRGVGWIAGELLGRKVTADA